MCSWLVKLSKNGSKFVPYTGQIAHLHVRPEAPNQGHDRVPFAAHKDEREAVEGHGPHQGFVVVLARAHLDEGRAKVVVPVERFQDVKIGRRDIGALKVEDMRSVGVSMYHRAGV